jgi:hypothetical protein
MKINPLPGSWRLSCQASLFAPVSFESRLLAATFVCPRQTGVPIFLTDLHRRNRPATGNIIAQITTKAKSAVVLAFCDTADFAD